MTFFLVRCFVLLSVLCYVHETIAARSLNDIFASIPLVKHNSIVGSTLKTARDGMTSPCTCGVFLEGQIANDGNVKLYENPVFSKEMDSPMYPCGIQGNRQCMKKCIDMVINYMPNIGPLVCSSIDRNCIKEKPYLFTKNCEGTWRNTGFSAGKEFCCSDGLETKCRPGAVHHQQRLQQQQKQPSSILDLLNTPSKGRSVPEILIGMVDRATNIASGVLSLGNELS